MKLDIKLLKRLYMIDHPSKGEQPMISFIINHCYGISNLKFELDHYNNLFITKNTTNPEYYPCVVAHLDQIETHKGPYRIVQNGDIISGVNRVDGSSCSLGADDANGICVALQLLNTQDNLKVVFTTEEECGAIGAREASININFFANVSYFLQADRKGKNSLITHTNCIDVVSPEFLKDLRPIMTKYGYVPDNSGTLTDVGELCYELKLAGCNISCGYYNQHTSKEYTRISELQNCLNFMEEILNTLPQVPYELEVSYYGHYGYFKENDPYGLYNQYDFEYDYEWEPDTEAWEKYDAVCQKAESEAPSELDYESIPCDHCRDMDCKNCKYINAMF